MREYVKIHIKCPVCGENLEKSYYASRRYNTTWWRIRCLNKKCKVDTGMQATGANVYEALMVMYFGAEADRIFEKKVPENDTDDTEDEL